MRMVSPAVRGVTAQLACCGPPRRSLLTLEAGKAGTGQLLTEGAHHKMM